MDYQIVLCLVLFKYSVSAFPKSGKQFDDYLDDLDDDEQSYKYESTLSDQDFRTTSLIDEPRSQYEVTEIVIDIPDNRTKGPIVTNYTIYRPLNTALTTDDQTIENINKTKCQEHDKKTTATVNKSSEGKNNYISILHVKAEFENKPEKVTPQVIVHRVPHLPGIKDYIKGIKEGLVNGFNSILHKHRFGDDGVGTLGPLAFLSKLHKKSSDTAHKIHDAVFGHTYDHKKCNDIN